MAKDDWYTFTTTDDGFKAIKYNKGREPLGEYVLNKTASSCSCPAHVPYCRHKKMLAIFQDMKRVDTGWLYNIDKDDWIEPADIPDLDGMDA